MNNRVKMKTSKGSYAHGGQAPSEGMIAIKIVQPFEAETEDGRRVMINGGQVMLDGGSVTLESKDDGTRSYGMGGRVKMDLSSNYEHGGQHPTNEEVRQRLAEQNEYTTQEVQGGLEAGAARETQKSKIKRRAELDPEYAINVPRVSADQVIMNATQGTDPGDAYGNVNVNSDFYMQNWDEFTQAVKDGDKPTAKKIYGQMQQQAYKDASEINAQFGYGDTEREYASGMVREGEMDFNLAFDPQYKDALFNIDNYPGGVPYMHPTMGLQYAQSDSGRGQATDKYIESKKPKGGAPSGVPGEKYEHGGVHGDPEKKKKENGEEDDELATPFAEMLDEVTVTAPQTRYSEASQVTDQELADQIVYDAVANNRDLLLGEYGVNKPTLAQSGFPGYKSYLDADNRQKAVQNLTEDSTDDDRRTGLNFQREFINSMRNNPEMYEMGPRVEDPGRPGKFTNKHFKFDFDSPEYKEFVREKANEQIQRRYSRTKDMIQDALNEKRDQWSAEGMVADDGSGFVDEDFRNMLKEKGLTFIPDPKNEGKFIIGKAQ